MRTAIFSLCGPRPRPTLVPCREPQVIAGKAGIYGCSSQWNWQYNWFWPTSIYMYIYIIYICVYVYIYTYVCIYIYTLFIAIVFLMGKSSNKVHIPVIQFANHITVVHPILVRCGDRWSDRLPLPFLAHCWDDESKVTSGPYKMGIFIGISMVNNGW